MKGVLAERLLVPISPPVETVYSDLPSLLIHLAANGGGGKHCLAASWAP